MSNTTKDKPIKPDAWKEDMRYYLNGLREGGSMNMFGAAAPLCNEYALSKKDSFTCLEYWMNTFSEDNA